MAGKERDEVRLNWTVRGSSSGVPGGFNLVVAGVPNREGDEVRLDFLRVTCCSGGNNEAEVEYGSIGETQCCTRVWNVWYIYASNLSYTRAGYLHHLAMSSKANRKESKIITTKSKRPSRPTP